MKATITERGQVSIPARLRREMRLRAGQTVVWSKVSDTECRLVAVPTTEQTPNPLSALGFAARHHLADGTTADWMKRLREGEE